jgi:hypothetical protein
LQDLLAVALGAADEIGLRHFLSNSKLATMGIQRCHTTMSRPRVPDAVCWLRWAKIAGGFVWPKCNFWRAASARLFD